METTAISNLEVLNLCIVENNQTNTSLAKKLRITFNNMFLKTSTFQKPQDRFVTCFMICVKRGGFRL